MKRYLRPVAILLALTAALAAVRISGVGQHLDAVQSWIQSLGPLGPLAYVGIYILAVVAAVPGSALTVAAGALFGSVVGAIVVSAGSTLGASLAFLVSRYAARDAVARWAARNDRFRRLDEMTRRHGASIVAVTRLVPIFPFNLLNYGFGLTRVPFWTYVFWSWLCMLPGTILYVVGADAAAHAATRGRVPAPLLAALGLGALILLVLVRLARRSLQEREADVEPSGPSSNSENEARSDA